jgi:hypothetical protein
MEIVQGRSRHAERSPDPVAARPRLLDLDLRHAASVVDHHRIEELRLLDGEQQEGETVGKRRERIRRKPDRIGKPDRHAVL